MEPFPWNTTTDGLADEENLTLTKAKHTPDNFNPSFNVLHTDTQAVVDKLKNSGFFFKYFLKIKTII
jgi:hypothetical protein